MTRYMMLAAGCFAALLFSGCFIKSGAGFSDKDRTINELNDALEASRSEVDDCRRGNELLQNENEKIDIEVRTKRSQIEFLNQAIEKQAAVISLQESVIRLFDDSQQTLQASIQDQIEAGNLETGGSSHSVKYILYNKLLFQTNGLELSPDGKALLTKLAEVLLEESYPFIRVQGHTDDRPLKSSSRFADNWELSAARAAEVVRFFHEILGIAPERMTAVGCGQFMPVAGNDTDEGRSMNRRIEIILESGTSPAATVEIPSF